MRLGSACLKRQPTNQSKQEKPKMRLLQPVPAMLLPGTTEKLLRNRTVKSTQTLQTIRHTIETETPVSITHVHAPDIIEIRIPDSAISIKLPRDCTPVDTPGLCGLAFCEICHTVQYLQFECRNCGPIIRWIARRIDPAYMRPLPAPEYVDPKQSKRYGVYRRYRPFQLSLIAEYSNLRDAKKYSSGYLGLVIVDKKGGRLHLAGDTSIWAL